MNLTKNIKTIKAIKQTERLKLSRNQTVKAASQLSDGMHPL